MADTPVKIIRGLTVHGKQIQDGKLDRDAYIKELDVDPGLYRDWVRKLSTGGGFVDPTRFLAHCGYDKLKFGPGAGLVLGVAVGNTTLRAGLVDANGHVRKLRSAETMHDQLALPPKDLLDRIAATAGEAMEAALKDEDLLVDEKLRLRGVAVAWPSPVDRDKRPGGHALSHRGWHNRFNLTQRVADRLNLDRDFSHALNDCWAAAIAVAFDQTRKRDHVKQEDPELTIVLRIGGGISAATIVIEPPQGDRSGDFGRKSGFADSVLLAGIDCHAGELGHVAVCRSTIDERNRRLPKGLGPLRPYRCSCTEGESVPRHLEAFVSRAALANRVSPGCTPAQVAAVVDRVLEAPNESAHQRALKDTES